MFRGAYSPGECYLIVCACFMGVVAGVLAASSSYSCCSITMYLALVFFTLSKDKTSPDVLSELRPLLCLWSGVPT